jgi:exodeoxyribonuclease VII large subunit
MAQHVLTITQVNEYIRSMMDRDTLLTGLAVKGEISNYKVYPSGHHYFTLKDEASTLRCVMFRASASKLKFKPENGMKIIAMGRITVYPRDGGYQLYCTAMALDGVGDLHAAFEQLKNKLAAQGLFDPAHKKPLPQYPGIIGIVTSAAGAAVHDMLRILRKRYPLTHVRLLPVRVQGAEAPREIAAAIAYANRYNLADLLIVGRGGGSIEDLWAFNDEIVAHAIYNSRIPVISAVGHEPDVTISDFVADLRAATPSNAAELAVPDQEVLKQSMDTMVSAMATALQRQLKASRRHLDVLAKSSALQSPDVYLQQRRNSLDHLQNRLLSAQKQTLSTHRRRYLGSAAKLDAMSPLKVLTRGYAVAQTADREVVCSINQLLIGDPIRVTLSDGVIAATVTGKEEIKHESEQ